MVQWLPGPEHGQRFAGVRHLSGLAWGDGSSGLSWSKDSRDCSAHTRRSGTVTAMDAYSGKPLWQLAGKRRQLDDGYRHGHLHFSRWPAVRHGGLPGSPVYLGCDAGRPRPRLWSDLPEPRQVAWSNDGRLAVAGGVGEWEWRHVADASGILGNLANRISTAMAVTGVPPGRRTGRLWPEAERTFSSGPRTPTIRTRSFMLMRCGSGEAGLGRQ